MTKSNYDKHPFITVTSALHPCVTGWDKIAEELQHAISRGRIQKPILVVDCYPGVDELAVLNELKTRLAPKLVIHAADAYHLPPKIDELVTPFLGGDDPVVGRFAGLSLVNFFNAEPLWRLRRSIDDLKEGLVLIVGCGASLIAWGHILVYADLTRRTAQERFRRNETGNLGVPNQALAANLKSKRAFFVDWRVADRWKRPLISRWDYVLDTNDPAAPKLAEAGDVRAGLREAVTRPFRLVPFFDATPWGGQWMKEAFDLDRHAGNFGLGVDGVPEENSLLLGFGDVRFEIPAIDLVFHQPRALLGESVHLRFGGEFPIRFNLLDTMGGANLSLQVHPLPEYLRQHFGVRHPPDASYYLLDAGGDASVCLGLREGVDPLAMRQELEKATTAGTFFPPGKYANQFSARKHDHFLIPPGTVHAPAANALALQIAATPYLFAFEMGNGGPPGVNRETPPAHLAPGLANVRWEHDARWIKANLVNRIEPLGSGDGWREEKTGLHEPGLIETRRHWFSKKVPHDTHGGVNVLNLVEGEAAVVESPTDAFAPFVVHHAETFVVPAAVGEYTIRPQGPSAGKECATLKAFVGTK